MAKPLELSEKDQARFWSKVALPNEQGCMLWAAGQDGNGYGSFRLGARMYRAHRISYILAYGPVPQGLQLDHLCRVRHCVAPLHLEAVTQQENARRGEVGKASGARERAKTHCPQGHAHDEENTYVCPRGSRNCRECARVRNRAYHRRRAVTR